VEGSLPVVFGTDGLNNSQCCRLYYAGHQFDSLCFAVNTVLYVLNITFVLSRLSSSIIFAAVNIHNII